ncbi:MAG: DUF3110 domain-containing protein [Cyanobacteria bacterium]|nr:DUF3110 domain-containing protein [Cyanobacteriota bacterium]
MRVFVLLFNARTENEGIHSLRVQDEEGEMHNVVLMFENEDDATRFGLMLEAQDFPPVTVEALEEEEVREFCEGAGYDCQLLKEGMLAVPPENNVDEVERDWNPDGTYDGGPGGGGSRDRASDEGGDGGFNNDELERLRQRLEKLL